MKKEANWLQYKMEYGKIKSERQEVEDICQGVVMVNKVNSRRL